MFSCIIYHYWQRSDITCIHNFYAAAPRISKKNPNVHGTAISSSSTTSFPEMNISPWEKHKKYECLRAELALSYHRIYITHGLFNLLGCPCLFCYSPRKICISLFNLEISALQRVTISPNSPQFANMREVICKPLKIDIGFHVTFFTLLDLFLV